MHKKNSGRKNRTRKKRNRIKIERRKKDERKRKRGREIPENEIMIPPAEKSCSNVCLSLMELF